MIIPFSKAHGARNDFLLTWRADVPPGAELASTARSICDRHTGAGADGWLLVTPPSTPDADGAIELYNSDGSVAELSGNGTRCAAAFLLRAGYGGDTVRIATGAGIKTLKQLKHDGLLYEFEMDMGIPEIRQRNFDLPLSGGPCDVTLVWVGNPQCAVPVAHFDFDWRAMGAEIESHSHFPNRTNVSFVKPVSDHAIDVRFYERGAGETMSSGTGSTGAAAAAIARGLVASPVEVQTPAGPLRIRVDRSYHLTGPAEIVLEGRYFTS